MMTVCLGGRGGGLFSSFIVCCFSWKQYNCFVSKIKTEIEFFKNTLMQKDAVDCFKYLS